MKLSGMLVFFFLEGGGAGNYTYCVNEMPSDAERFIIPFSSLGKISEGVVSKETVVLRRWGSTQKFGFINGVDNVNWPPYRDSKS